MTSPASFARMALSAVKAANLLMSLAIAASLGILMIFSLNCMNPLGPVTAMEPRDSLAVGAILKANNLKWPADRSFAGVDNAGRVTRLDLHAMGIEAIPSGIGALKSLRRLGARGKAIRTVPLSLMELPLEYLDLGDNRLCAPDSKDADPIPEAMRTWLDGIDRGWRESQRCP
jgi:hypothetical protein